MLLLISVSHLHPAFLSTSTSSVPEKQCRQPGQESRLRAGPCGRSEVSVSEGQGRAIHLQSQGPLDWRPLLLVIPLRMGINNINPVYIQALKVWCSFSEKLTSLFCIQISYSSGQRWCLGGHLYNDCPPRLNQTIKIWRMTNLHWTKY